MDRFRSAAFEVLAAAGLPTAVTLTRQRAGIANRVFVASADERVVVRLGTGSDGQHFGKSAALLTACAGRVKTQELIYLDDSCQRFPWPVMVVSWLPGRPLARSWATLGEAAREQQVDRILEELQRLHGLPLDSISAFAGLPTWSVRRQAEFDQRRLAAIQDRTQDARLVAELSDLWDAESTALDRVGRSVPVHDDINLTNVLFDGAHFTGLIDFDDGDAAPPDIDWWQFAEVLSEDPAGVDAATVRRWFLPHYDFGRGDAALARLDTLYWIMRQLTEVVSWRPVHESRRMAAANFDRVFRQAHLDAWFERVNP